jgi:hypothetical protein
MRPQSLRDATDYIAPLAITPELNMIVVAIVYFSEDSTMLGRLPHQRRQSLACDLSLIGGDLEYPQIMRSCCSCPSFCQWTVDRNTGHDRETSYNTAPRAEGSCLQGNDPYCPTTFVVLGMVGSGE